MAQCLSRVSSEYHIPVMLHEAMEGLSIRPVFESNIETLDGKYFFII